MTVTVSAPIIGSYTLFRGAISEAGPVGTFAFDIAASGDSGGGEVVINAQMKEPKPLGFKAILRLLAVSSSANGTSGDHRLAFLGANERLEGAIHDVKAPVVHGSTEFAQFEPRPVYMSLPMPMTDVSTSVVALFFETNTDGKTYHFHGYGLVYNEERLARGRWDAGAVLRAG